MGNIVIDEQKIEAVLLLVEFKVLCRRKKLITYKDIYTYIMRNHDKGLEGTIHGALRADNRRI